MGNNFELTIVIGERKEDKIINQKCLTGKEKEIVDFINSEFLKRFLKLKDENLIVFNINPETEEDLKENWFTLQQLVDSNIIELEE